MTVKSGGQLRRRTGTDSCESRVLTYCAVGRDADGKLTSPPQCTGPNVSGSSLPSSKTDPTSKTCGLPFLRIAKQALRSGRDTRSDQFDVVSAKPAHSECHFFRQYSFATTTRAGMSLKICGFGAPGERMAMN